MGIPLEMWRARIGTFVQRPRPKTSVSAKHIKRKTVRVDRKTKTVNKETVTGDKETVTVESKTVTNLLLLTLLLCFCLYVSSVDSVAQQLNVRTLYSLKWQQQLKSTWTWNSENWNFTGEQSSHTGCNEYAFHCRLLLLSGDIEMNPGPPPEVSSVRKNEDQSPESAMDPRCRLALQKAHRDLVRDLDVERTLDYLYAKLILTLEQKQRIEGMTTDYGRRGALLNLLPERGQGAYDALCESLSADQPWLKDLLDENHGNITQDELVQMKQRQLQSPELADSLKRNMHDRLDEWKTALEEGVSDQGELLPYITQPCDVTKGHQQQQTLLNTIKVVENSRPGDRLVIYGEAGMGKTTLLKQLARLWIKGENEKLQEKFAYVFLIPLKLVGRGTLLNIICDELGLVPASSLKDLKKSLGLCEHRVLYLLDSYEELRGDVIKAKRTDIDDLITGKLFPRSTVVVTSRPGSKLKKLEDQTTAQLKDLPENEVKRIIQHYFGGNKDAVDKVQRSFPAMAYLQKPINLALFYFIITQNKHLTLSYTQAELLSLVLQYIMLAFGKTKNLGEFTPQSGSYIGNRDIPKYARLLFSVIAKKCYEQRKKNNVTLHIEDADDLKDFLDLNGLFTVGPDTNTVLLPHRLFIEYFAAAHLAENPDVFAALFKDIKEESEKKSPRPRLSAVVRAMGLENILRFVVALSPQPQLGQVCRQVGSLFVLEREKIEDCDNYQLVNFEYYSELLRDCCDESEKRLLAAALLDAPVTDVTHTYLEEEEDRSYVLLSYLDYEQRVTFLKKVHNISLSVKESTLSCTGGNKNLGIGDRFVVALVYQHDCIIKADELYLRGKDWNRLDLPASVFTLMSGVRQLVLWHCTLCGGLPDYTLQQSSPHPPNSSLDTVEMHGVAGLEHCDVITTCQCQLVLMECGDIRVSSLETCFPKLSELEVGFSTVVVNGTENELTSWLSTIQAVKELKLAPQRKEKSLRFSHLISILAGRGQLEYLELRQYTLLMDTSDAVKQNSLLSRLKLYDCKGDIELDQFFEVCNSQCPQLKKIEVWRSNLVFDDEKVESVKELPGLQELTLQRSAIHTPAGRRLSQQEAKQLLHRLCPSAEIIVWMEEERDDKDEMEEILPDPEMRRVYENACLSGERAVLQTRLMLIGRFAAGKTSLKRSLLKKEFIPEHNVTHGLEAPDGGPEDAIAVDQETVLDWKPVPQDHRKDFIRELVKAIRESTAEPEATRNNVHSDDRKHPKQGQGFTVGPDKTPLDSTPDSDNFEGPTTSETTSGTQSERQATKNRKTEIGNKLKLMEMEISNGLLSNEGQERIWLTIWDFGGQHVYYTSHQAFLSNQVVYLLVNDITKPLDEASNERNTPESAIEYLGFWLNSVHTHLVQRPGHGSQDKNYIPPVIIVCTKTDKIGENTDERERQVETYKLKLKSLLRRKPYYDHVKGIIAVSNCLPDDSGIEHLREKIVKVASMLPYWGKPRPIKWLLLVLELKVQAEQKQEPVIKMSELTQKASECGVPTEEVDAFLAFHHNLGDLIFFNEKETSDIIIISPQWLASVLSVVITKDDSYREEEHTNTQLDDLERGILSETTAVELIGKSEQLKGCKPEKIIKMMEKFDILILCKVKSKSGDLFDGYIVPCLTEPFGNEEIEIKGGSSTRFHFKFVPKTVSKNQDPDKYGFLPQGLFHRIISRCSRIEGWICHEDALWSDHVKFNVGDFVLSLYVVQNGITLFASDFSEQELGQSFADKEKEHADALSDKRKNVINVIETVTKDFFPNLAFVPYLECDCGPGKHGYIRIEVSAERLEGKEPCPVHKKHLKKEKWNIWFGKEAMKKTTHRLGQAQGRNETESQPRSEQHQRTESVNRLQQIGPRIWFWCSCCKTESESVEHTVRGCSPLPTGNMMSGDDENLLRRNRVGLMKSINLEGSTLLAELRARDVITRMEDEVIKADMARAGNTNAVGKLLDTLSRGDDNTIDAFIYALRKSGHTAAADTYLREPNKADII